MEKVLYHKIEKDVKNLGKDGMYPTQFLVDIKDLRKVSETTKEKDGIYLVQGKPMYVLMGYGGRLKAYVDGFHYIGVIPDGDFTTDPFERYDLGDGKIGFSVIGIEDKTIEDGVIMGKGMQTYKRGKTSRATKAIFEYDGDSEVCGVEVERSDGKEMIEAFYALGWYGINPGYEDEVLDKCQKRDKFIKKLIRK